MATQLTDSLRNLLAENGLLPESFAGDFDAWKASCPAGEYNSYAFGKDSAYVRPQVGGEPYILMHVHLAPRADATALREWDEDRQLRTRTTSDRVLIYVHSDRFGYLLLFIFDEPDAHAIARMETPEDRQLMHQIAVVADTFLQTGKIDA